MTKDNTDKSWLQKTVKASLALVVSQKKIAG